MKRVLLIVGILSLATATFVWADLLNGSFENAQQDTATNTEYWAQDVPPGWTFGGYWGEADVRGWRAYDGTNEATLHNWGGGAADSGWWQTVTNTIASEGSIWIASAWAVSDNGNWGGGVYTANNIDIKIEFYQNDHSTLAGAVTNSYSPPGETWTYMSVTGTAPANSYYARFVMAAVGQGSSGAFQFDDASLTTQIPEPTVGGLIGLGAIALLAIRRKRS